MFGDQSCYQRECRNKYTVSPNVPQKAVQLDPSVSELISLMQLLSAEDKLFIKPHRTNGTHLTGIHKCFQSTAHRAEGRGVHEMIIRRNYSTFNLPGDGKHND